MEEEVFAEGRRLTTENIESTERSGFPIARIETNGGRLRFMDVSDAANPALYLRYKIPGTQADIQVDGDMVYVNDIVNVTIIRKINPKENKMKRTVKLTPPIFIIFTLSLVFVIRVPREAVALEPENQAYLPLIMTTFIDQVLFQSYRDGDTDIFLINADGTHETELTNNSAYDWDANWSPDGMKVAYVTDIDGNPEIYTMNADGSGKSRLTNNTQKDHSSSWSPDGARIAFQSDRDGGVNGNNEIYVMTASGSDQTRVTYDVMNHGGMVWAPNGQTIAYTALGDLYIINSDGTGKTPLTDGPALISGPNWWSPDSNQIGFESELDNNREIFVININGTGLTNLTNNPDIDTSPARSPDGSKIAFVSYRDGNSEIYIMNADGSGVYRLTNDPAVDQNPAWSPDGSMIAFSANREGNYEIYTVNLDGTGLVRLTNNGYDDVMPEWRPRK